MQVLPLLNHGMRAFLGNKISSWPRAPHVRARLVSNCSDSTLYRLYSAADNIGRCKDIDKVMVEKNEIDDS